MSPSLIQIFHIDLLKSLHDDATQIKVRNDQFKSRTQIKMFN